MGVEFYHWSTHNTATAEQLKTKMKLFKMLLPLLPVATCSGFSLNALLGGSAEEEPAAAEQEVEDFEEDLEEEDMEEENEEEEEEEDEGEDEGEDEEDEEDDEEEDEFDEEEEDEEEDEEEEEEEDLTA